MPTEPTSKFKLTKREIKQAIVIIAGIVIAFAVAIGIATAAPPDPALAYLAAPIGGHQPLDLLAAIGAAPAILRGAQTPHAPPPELLALNAEGGQQTPAGARVVNQVLSNVARGYQHEMAIWQYLFPPVPVSARGGKIITFGTEDFRAVNVRRAPGGDTQRVQFGYHDKDFNLVQRALDGVLPDEIGQEAMQVGIDKAALTVRKTMETISLQIEIEAARLATTASNYTNKVELDEAKRWDKEGVDPTADIETAKEAVADAIGREPNTVIMGTNVWRALRRNETVRKEIRQTENAARVRTEQVANLFDVQQVVIARCRSQAKAKGPFVPLWGNNVIVAYTELGSLQDAGMPSFGWTYRLGGYPEVAMPYYDPSAKSTVFPVTTQDTPVIAGKDAGYLISKAVG